jgi:hypothetical protein
VTLRILPYDYYVPKGAMIKSGGHVDYETRQEYLGLVSGSVKGIANWKWQAEPEDKSHESRPYIYDIHRRISQYLRNESLQEAVLEFAENYGDWFTNNVISDGYKLRTLNEWRSEWNEVDEVLPKINVYSEQVASAIDDKLNENTKMTIQRQEWRRKMKFNTAIRPINMSGWVWALIAKDYYEDTTYEPCGNKKCERELPSVSPIGGRHKLEYCSKRCRNAENYKTRKLEQVEVISATRKGEERPVGEMDSEELEQLGFGLDFPTINLWGKEQDNNET